MYINTTICCDDIELKTIILNHLEKTILHYPIQTDGVQLREMVFKNVLLFGRFLKYKKTNGNCRNFWISSPCFWVARYYRIYPPNAFENVLMFFPSPCTFYVPTCTATDMCAEMAAVSHSTISCTTNRRRSERKKRDQQVPGGFEKT